MRINPLHLLERSARECQKVMDYRHFELAHDREVVLEEQVEIAVNAAANRVFDRQHPEINLVVVDRREDILKALTGHQMSVRSDLPRGGFAERSWFSLIRDAHVLSLPWNQRRLKRRPPPNQTAPGSP